MGVVDHDLEAGGQAVGEGDGHGEHGEAAEGSRRGEREQTAPLGKRAVGFCERGAVHGGQNQEVEGEEIARPDEPDGGERGVSGGDLGGGELVDSIEAGPDNGIVTVLVLRGPRGVDRG